MMKSDHFYYKKKYGQNFLNDENILNNIISMAEIMDDTLVLEIGVGSGNLTKKIAKKAMNVIGYEIDDNLRDIITKKLSSYKNIDIIYDDFLKRDIKKDIEKYNYKYLYVVANLPYYITTPIITKLIEENIKINKMVIMVQKEVADRLSAKPGSKDYNSLTIFLNYYFSVRKLFDVSRNAFVPKPNVDSAVIKLKRNENKLKLKDEALFFKIVKDAFKFKRKNLKNNLKGYDLDKLSTILSKYNLDLTVRAEHLTIEQFADIANNI